MDAVMEFLAEGMSQAPVAVGALIGFAIGIPWVGIAIWRDSRRNKAWKREHDAAHEAWRQDHEAWVRRHSPKPKHEEA